MPKAEFETEVKNGVIHLPRKYSNAKRAKIIILDNEDFIFRTVNNPVRLGRRSAFLTREKANER
ncbi:MAG: hypothetical protein M1276_02160 [Deltaproteobacteria bacterium]|jgi:hypothetical protein|nr:hypothetical protein [Deltaproteobacteria bacterium]